MAQYNRKFVTGGQMRTPVIFYVVKPSDDFMPGESVSETYYQCFVNVYPPSQKDMNMTDNKAVVTMVTYYPVGLEITDDMKFEIDLPRYKGKLFNIHTLEDDTDNHRNIKIIGEYSE
ncbi:phage head-tail adapter protein [Mammaliicoccus vitulinus]|uniref:phage head-tail adapter protein n=1 Tax=Mammaliicoccus vitulinus TaxID=71237 RepID=UPI001AACFABE|nr:phage head-tail adapter protein [Mammaliicoccus vitulinus]MBO3076740.1 phage head-tail adapter protein [Mammaliicoccus vitulinus]